MLVLLIVSCFALVVTYFASKDELPFGLEFAFVLITFVAAIHYNYGNDYSSYMYRFKEFSNYDFDWYYILSHKYYKEPGWYILNYFFIPFGFFSFVIFLSIVQNVIYGVFIKTYIPKEWWVLGVFIYLFSNSLYILNMSMMRQGFAVSLFVLAWMLGDLFGKKFIVLSALLCLFAASIHSSASILYPCLLFFFMKKTYAPYFSGVVIVTFVLLFMKPDLINSFLLPFNDVEDVNRLLLKYEGSSVNMSYGLGMVLILIPFVVMLVCLIKNESFSDREIKIVAIAVLAYMIIPFRQSIPMISRLGYYFVAFSIVAIPVTYKKIRYPFNIVAIACFIILYVAEYINFFFSETYSLHYLEFHSIFEEML